MKILHIETSSRNCSVSISDGEELLCLCEEVSENYKQSEKLHHFVEFALQGAGIQLKDLDAIHLGMGPGSYTGLRIGASTAKGFCFGLNIPLLASNSLHSMKERFINKGYDYIIPLIDARRMEVYTAVFNGETGDVVKETESKILEETSFEEYRGKKVLFVGDGATKTKEIVKFDGAEFEVQVFPSAKFMIKEGLQRLTDQKIEDVAYFEPFYLKEFQGVKLADKNKKD